MAKHRVPPEQNCAGCGAPVGRSWRETIFCAACRKLRHENEPPELAARRAERHAAHGPTTPPTYDASLDPFVDL